MRRTLRVAFVAAAVLAGTTLVIRASDDSDAELQFQLATLLFEETRYGEALDAFDRATAADDAALAVRAYTLSLHDALPISIASFPSLVGQRIESYRDRKSVV